MPRLRVNGEPRDSASTTLAGLLVELGQDPSRPGIAIALNDRVVHRTRWDQTTLQDDDRVEIVAAVQGG